MLTHADVQDNVETLFKQLQAAEDRLEALEVMNHPKAQSEEGLPLTEITEELDEDGNVICQWQNCSVIDHMAKNF